jgi:hypothetical protein
MLQEALKSVAEQTALSVIDRVLVSENGSCRDSEKVCAEFKQLPIHYVYQDPPLPALYHFQSILPLIRTSYIAILHDDDWWGAEHLEKSYEILESDQVITVFSNFAEAESPRHMFTLSYKSFRVWAFTGRDFSQEYIKLQPEENFLCSLWDTSYHYSTCVGKTEFIAAGVEEIVRSGNSYDNDRTFAIFLGEQGSLAYVPAITSYVRVHQGQDSAREAYQKNDEGWKLKAQTTKWIATHYPSQLESATAHYNEHILPLLTERERLELELPVGEAQRNALRSLCGLHLMMQETASDDLGASNHQMSPIERPPMMQRLARRVLRKLAHR